MLTYDRSGIAQPTTTYEKLVILPELDEKDPCIIGWSDARFAIDIMMEHAEFFVLLMPPEVAHKERKEALSFYLGFKDILSAIDATGIPSKSELASFATTIIEAIKPFNDYKQRMLEAQVSGKLRSLVFPLFFDHTSREAIRWMNRLAVIAKGESEYDKLEVQLFWSEIMEDHAEFISHLLDPTEKTLIETSDMFASTFKDLNESCEADCDTQSIITSAQDILEFKTAAVRGIEAGMIKSIIDPRLADHVRREALKFVDELKRMV